MIDFATATFAVIAKYIAEKLATDANYKDGWVIRSLLTLAKEIKIQIITDLAAKVYEWKLGHSNYNNPLSSKQFELARKLTLRNVATLAKIAQNKSNPSVEPVKQEEVKPIKPARKSRKKASYEPTPDVNGLAPWEHDDRRFEGVGMPEPAVEF